MYCIFTCISLLISDVGSDQFESQKDVSGRAVWWRKFRFEIYREITQWGKLEIIFN